METSRRSNLVIGMLLVFLGAVFLIYQLIPALHGLISWTSAWPLIVVGVGLAFLLIAAVGHVPGMAIPASIIGGIGLLLLWQNSTNNWGSWAYAWTLIPGYVGIGLLLMGLLSGKTRQVLSGGLWLIVISLVLFFIFGSFLGGPNFGDFWPILLIGLGFLILLRPLIRARM